MYPHFQLPVPLKDIWKCSPRLWYVQSIFFMILLFYSFLIINHSVPFLSQTPTPDQEGPTSSNLAFLESVSSKELAYYISQYDYELFNAVNVVSTSSCLVNFSYFQKKPWQNAKKSPMHMLDRDFFGMYFTLNFLHCYLICSTNLFTTFLGKRITTRSQRTLTCYSNGSMR